MFCDNPIGETTQRRRRTKSHYVRTIQKALTPARYLKTEKERQTGLDLVASVVKRLQVVFAGTGVSGTEPLRPNLCNVAKTDREQEEQ